VVEIGLIDAGAVVGVCNDLTLDLFRVRNAT